MPFDVFGSYTVHLTESPIPSPIALAGLVEASFPGYEPSSIGKVLFNRVDSGLSTLQCQGTFFNAGLAGSANPTGAFLVFKGQLGPELVGFVPIAAGSYGTIPHGAFVINCIFGFNSKE